MIFSAKKNIIANNKRRQFIVVGVQRGGTSAIAATLEALGVSLGDNYHEPNFEDLGLANAFRAGDWKKVATLINNYEEKYEKFAWKLPDSNNKLQRISKLFSNPNFIFVYRDIFAIASRKQYVHGGDISDAMHSSLAAYKRILKFTDNNSFPALHISYEKLLLSKEAHLRELAEFCDIEASDNLIKQASKTIEASPKIYTQWADISLQIVTLNREGFDGYIDQVSEKQISGWFLKIGSNEPVTIELFVNDLLIADCLCDDTRGDLITAGKSNSGKAGFNIPFPEGVLKKADRVSINPKGYSISLISDY